MSRRNTNNTDPYSSHNRYPLTARAQERSKRKGRMIGSAATFLSISAGLLGVTHSDAIKESFRTQPLSVSEQLSEANYQAKVLQPARKSVNGQINSISLVKDLVDASPQGNGMTATLSNETNTDEMSLSVSSDMLFYSTKNSTKDGTFEDLKNGSITVSRDADGTSIILESQNAITHDHTPMVYGQEITFHNPDKNAAVDLRDLATVSRIIDANDTEVKVVKADGGFGNSLSGNRAWYTEVAKPLTVTFDRNDDGGFTVKANTETLETPFMADIKATPTIDQVLDFALKP